MRRLGALGVVLAMALLAFGLSVVPASATVLCKTLTDPCSSGTYSNGTPVEAILSSTSRLSAKGVLGTVSCTQSTLKGEVSNAGKEQATALIALTSLSLSECSHSGGGCSVIVLSEGTAELHSTGSGNATMTFSGLETTVECGSAHCIYSLSSTDVGTLKGGDTARLPLSATVPRTGGRSGALCESSATWTAEYAVVSPVPLRIAERTTNVLCNVASNPCTSGTYSKGTTIAASVKSGGKSVLNTAFGEIRCSEAGISGEVTSTNAESGTVTSLSFGECNCGVKTLQKGSFSVRNAGGGNGTLTLEGVEITTECLTTHCIWSGADISLSLKGGEMGSVTAGGVTLQRTGGTSGATCGTSGEWTADYTVTKPEPFYAEPAPPPSTVICKTATNPCTGGTYGSGTVVAAGLKSGSKSILHPPFGDIECSTSSIEGEIANAGGTGVTVSGALSAFTFASCNATVTTLKKGTFSITSPNEGSGTLTLEGFEITVEFIGTHCIFGGGASLSLKGGEMSSFGTATLSRTKGRSGVFCGSTAEWTVEYTITKPEPLYVEGV